MIITSTFDMMQNAKPKKNIESMIKTQIRVSNGLKNDIIWASTVGTGLANAR